MEDLFAKYDQALPRYTSYPTVPYWDKAAPAATDWRKAVSDAWLNGGKDLSLYIHLLYCESLCTYCACNTRITKNHAVEEPYISRLLKEWEMYREVIGEKPRISELHLGGGTPTFFSPENLSRLIDTIRDTAEISEDAAFSFEAHPANTTSDHLRVLYDRGFRRISIGVQDFNPEVQRLINRRQSEDQVAALTTLARITGFTSINFDLVYGLPKQTVASILETVQKVVRLRPDRIAFYSYAHVPWMRPGQRAYTEADLPQGAEKRALYEHARALLELAGYIEIGLDHFALPADELKRASDNGKLHRNFMGYTEKHTGLLLGLGVSSISDAGTMLMQNVKDVKSWNAAIDAGVLPMLRGHKLTAEDLILRRHILNIMCRDSTSWENDADRPECFGEIIERLQPLCDDGLIILSPGGLVVQPKGKPFLRNIGSCFDARMMKEKPASSLFSRTA